MASIALGGGGGHRARRAARRSRGRTAATGVSDAISHGACEVAHRVGAAAIVSATCSGATARSVARTSPRSRSSPSAPAARVVNQLALSWGVCPLHGDPTAAASRRPCARPTTWCSPAATAERGDVVVITAGLLTNQPGKTNLIKGHTLE